MTQVAIRSRQTSGGDDGGLGAWYEWEELSHGQSGVLRNGGWLSLKARNGQYTAVFALTVQPAG